MSIGFSRPSASSLLTWLGLLVSLVCGYLVLRDTRWNETWTALRNSNYLWLLPALVFFALSFVLRAVRWRVMFAPERRPGLRPVTKALFVGYFFNNLLPVRAGEAARAVALRRLANTSLAETTATIVIERAYDVLSLLVLLFVALPWLPHVDWIQTAVVFAAALTLGLIVAIVVVWRYRERPFRFAFRYLFRLPYLRRRSLERASENFLLGLAGLRAVRVGFVAFFWTIASWLPLMISFWLVTVSFDLKLSPLAGLFVTICVGLGMILPSSPAALGVFEGATIIALSAFGVGESRALPYALVLHALNVLPFFAIGFLAFGIARLRDRALFAEVE